jgi:hypothetical protein
LTYLALGLESLNSVPAQLLRGLAVRQQELRAASRFDLAAQHIEATTTQR